MKKILSILAVLLCMAAIPKVFAYNFVSDGIYYDITGGSPNTVAVTYATGSYNSYSGEVSIPSTVTYNGTTYTVTAIGNSAFRNCSNLSGVTIPGTVESIGEYAFYQCSRLHTVDFPSNLTTIGERAFYYSGLYSVTVPAAVTSIGSYAFSQCSSIRTANFYASNCTSAPSVFSGCSRLDTVIIGSNVHNLPSSVFSNLSALRTVHIPNSVTSMGSNPFANCANLDTIVVAGGNSVFSSGNNSSYIVNTNTHTLVTGCKRTVIPNSVTSIGGSAFSGCTGLTGALTIPNQVTVIGASAYSGCSGLTSVTIGHSVDSIGNSAFSNCSGISSVAFNADSCRYMGTASSYGVFYGCSSFSTLTIGNNVKAIPAYAFYECGHLTGMLVIPNSVKYVGESAFRDCNGLTSLSIGNSVASIGGSAFYNCSNMRGTLTIPQNVKTVGSSAFYGCTRFSSIAFNADSCTTGSFSGCSNVTSLTIGNNVKVIPASAFSGLSQISGVLTIPNSVLTIGNNAFSNCSGLTGTLTIPNSVLTIGEKAFQNCSGLTSLTIGNAVSTIGNNAFSNCGGLTSVVFNADSCVSMGSAFSGCTGPATLTIGENVKVIPAYAFQGFTGLTGDLTIPNSVLTIGNNAFRNCSGLTSLTIGNAVSAIGSNAFSDCTGLPSLTIGNAVSAIGSNAFSNCGGLTSVVFNADRCVSMGDYYGYVFSGCTGPATLTIGDNVKTIPSYAFIGLGLTDTLVIPDSVQTIGNNAFSNCSGLTSLTIGNAVSTIGYNAFSNCTGLTSVFFNADSCVYMESAFSGCTGPATLTIGENVKVIPAYAFQGFTGLTGDLTIPNSVLTIGYNAFSNCSGLTSLTIGNAVSTIGNNAFSNCTGLTSVVFNADSCVYMESAFSGCTGPATLTIGENVKVIPAYAFYNHAGLTGKLTIPDSTLYVGYDAFANTGFDTLVIGKSVSYIGDLAFRNCQNLKTVFFNPDSCLYMGGYYGSTLTQGTEYAPVFYGCNNFRELYIGENVKVIPSNAFAQCDSITSIITIHRGVVSIGSAAFYNCHSLTNVIFNADSCIFSTGNSNYYNFSGDAVVFAGCNNIISLLIGNNVKYLPKNTFKGLIGLHGTIIVPDSVAVIGDQAFMGCTGIDSVIIGNSVVSMYDAFRNCTNLSYVAFNADSCENARFPTCPNIESISIGNNVKIIPNYIFYNCSGITGCVNIPNSVNTIGDYAFQNCANIDSLIIGKSVASINIDAFKNCSGLSYVEFNADSCMSIGSYSNGYSTSGTIFDGCTHPSSLVIGDNVKVIPQNAFNGLTGLQGTLIVPDSVVSIGNCAFKGCSNLTSLVIGKSVREILSGSNWSNPSAFAGCSGITTMFFNADSCTVAGNANYPAFQGLTNLTSLSIGNNVKVIPDFAFKSLHMSGKVVIPESTTYIGKNAFNYCSYIDTLILGQSVAYIGREAFSSCGGLRGSLSIPKVETIPTYAFRWCGIDTLVIGKNVLRIDTGAFYGCSHIKHVSYNADSCSFAESLNYRPFANCDSIVSLSIGNNVKYIPAYAFYSLNHITGTLTIPDSVKTIGSFAFSSCSGLTKLVLGRSVDTIRQGAFSYCTGLTSITSYNATPPTLYLNSTHPFSSVDRYIPVHVPCGSAQAYRSAWTYSSTNANSYFYNIYETLQPYQLSALSSDTLKGTVQVTSQATCTDPAVIEATPSFFYVFDHWSDGNTDNPRTITLTQDTTIMAYFREYALNINCDTAFGRVVMLQQPTAENPQATVTAQTTDSCYVFAGWSNGSTDNPLTISVSQDTTLTAIFNSVVNLQLSVPVTICQGDSTILVASGADSYLWFNGETSPVISILPENTLEVSVTGTNQNGCSTTKRHQIGVLPKPTLTLSGSTDICEGESTTITCSGTPQTIFFEGFENTLSSEWWNWGENGASWYSTIGTSIDAYEGERAYAHNGNGFNYLLSPTIHVPEDGLTLSWTAKQIREDGFNAAYYIYVNYVNNPSISNILYDYYYDNMLEEYWEERSIDLSDLAGQDIRLAFGQTYGDWNGFGTVIIDNIRLSGNPDFVWSDGYIGYQRSLNVDGIWQVSISDNNGCSTTDSVTISVWQPDTIELTVTAPTNPYVLNGESFCTSGDYTQILQNIHGCDSVVNLHLTVPSDTTVIYDTLCGGSKYIQQSYMSPEEYQQILTMLEYQYGNTIPFELSYDSITQIVTLKQVSISFYEQWETGYNEYGYPTYGSFDTTLYLNYNVWKDSAYYDNFSYTISYTSSSGCDSTVTRHRKIYFSDFAYYIVSACGRHIWQGDSLFGMNGNTGNYQIYHAGDTLTQSGDYAQAYTCKNGCDSIIYLHFEFIPASYEDISDTVCNSYTYNGITYTESGDYTFNTDTISVIVRELYYYGEWGYNDSDGNFIRFRPNGWSNLYDEYNYETDTYTYYYYDQNGVYHPYLGETILYNDTVPACKSVTLHLVVTQPTTGDTTAVACNSFTWHGNTYTQSGDYTYTVTSATGCDGVVTLHLTITQPTTGDITAEACNSFTWYGNTYTQSGNYTHTMTNAAGCDSVVTLHLTITQPTVGDTTAVACESFTWHGTTYTQSGNYTHTMTNAAGCDSVVTLHLTLAPSNHTDLTVAACGEYVWMGSTYTTSGNYSVTYTNATGCDSIVTLHLTINPIPQVAITGNTTICPGGGTMLTATGADSYLWSNYSSNASIPVNMFGIYSVTGTTSAGCFNTATVTVLVAQPPVITITGNTDLCAGESTTLTANGGLTYMWSNGSTAANLTTSAAGSYQVIGYDENGCNSMASITVSVWQPATSNIYITSFDSCYTWFGSPYCQSGNYTHTLQTIHGCDSVITLHLTLEEAITNEYSATACNSYTWNGITYSQSGNYSQTFTAANGNDSIVTLHLTVNLSTNGDTTAVVCGSFEWHGNTYTQSGNYTYTTTNAAGCDSVVTLHLTIHQPTTGDTTAVVCESFSWHGNTYTQSGNYTHTMSNAAGCDSVVTLHLTVNQTVAVTDTRTVCASELPIVWNGVQFAGAGTQTATLQTVNGCDSVVTMTLTVNQPTTGDTTAVACETITWHGSTYTQSGNYTYTTTNVAGCDSVVTLHLTINQPTTGDTTAVACESFTWHGSTYTQSGDYTYTTTNVAGCDSVVTLHLTVNDNVTSEFSIVTEDSCYIWNGMSYCASGDYTQTLQTVHGCDSVVTLHLTITVGVDVYDGFDFRVYPNPASTIVNVQFIMNNVQLEDAGMQVLDMYGKLVKVVPITGETTSINVSDLADGVYFVRLRTDAGTVTKRFVKN